jgi:hypothetical protein
VSYFFNEAARVEHLEHVAYSSPVKLGSAHDTCWLSMRQWGPSVKLRIVIELSSRLLFVSTAYQVFLTTSSIGLWLQTLKFWSLPRIVVGQTTGWAGFNWSLNTKMHSLPEPEIMKTTSPIGALQFSRAYTHSIEALHTLCCSLEVAAYPEYENIQASVAELRGLVTRFDPVSPYAIGGRIAASIERSHYTKRTRMAQLIWDIHREFGSYMQRAA